MSLVAAPSWSLWIDPALDLVGIFCGGRLARPAASQAAQPAPSALDA